MKVICTANAGDYHAWFGRAMLDDSVWPWLSIEPRYYTYAVSDDDWSHRILMSDDGTGVCTLKLPRGEDRSITLGLWVLASPVKAMTAAGLMQGALAFASRYDVVWLDTFAHETNHASIAVNRKAFGEPWGVEPGAAWDGRLRKFVGLAHFRAAIDGDSIAGFLSGEHR